MTEEQEKERHDKGGHHEGGERRHFCQDWDGMLICDKCDEFEACLCYADEDELVGHPS